jgi:hypothetical protein
MSRTGALHLASGLGGKISKEEVKSAVEQYVYAATSINNLCFLLTVRTITDKLH